MKIAVTGATGFVGGELAGYMAAQGHVVLRLQRRSISSPTDRFFDVRSIDSIPDLTGVDALIHTAFVKYDKIKCPDSSEINITMTLALERACHKAGTKFVFLSTMSAHDGAVSHYGKHKYEIEQQLDTGSLIFRLGLVIGRMGLFDSIRSAIRKGAFIPLIDGGTQPIQTIAVSDICRVIEKALQDDMSGIYTIGTVKVYTLRELYTGIAHRLNKNPVFIPVPYGLAYLALSMIEILRLPLSISKENLLGLKQLKAFDSKDDLARLGISIMGMEEALDEAMNGMQGGKTG